MACRPSDQSSGAAYPDVDEEVCSFSYDDVMQGYVQQGQNAKLKFFFIGKAGQGKSTLINSLWGMKVTEEGVDFGSATKCVQKYIFSQNGVDVELWDTPGFQMDGKRKEEEILKEIAQECKAFDLVLYCIRMDEFRWPTEGDIQTIRKITREFGKEIWDHTLFILTFANSENIMEQCPDDEEEESYFSNKVSMWEEHIKEVLQSNAWMTPDQAQGIKAVPVGTYRKKKRRQNPWKLPDREDWFLWFWMDCLEKMNQIAVPGLLQFNYNRLNFDEDNSTSSPEAEAYQRQVTTGNYPRPMPAPGDVTSLDIKAYDASPSPLKTSHFSLEQQEGLTRAVHDSTTPTLIASASFGIPEPGRAIPLRDLLKRMLKDKNSGFLEYVKKFAEARGREVWGFGHVGGVIEGLFVWLGSGDKNTEDKKKEEEKL